MSKGTPQRQLGKSKFSMYLRTKCDRELYLSLFSNNVPSLKAAGIPIPLKSRPGVQLITSAGTEFEYGQFDALINALPGRVLHKSNGRAPLELAAALRSANISSFLLQPGIEPQSFRDLAFTNIGVPKARVTFIPELAGLRPDVIYIGDAGSAEFEVLPNGNRRRLKENDPRRPLSIIDLKNITEANASYSAEVCLYAFFLANWLQTQKTDIAQGFFVSDQVYLWRHVEMPRFTKILGTVAGGDHEKRIEALLQDLREGLVNYLVYMPSVRKFFVEDVPRVVEKGDKEGWQAVEYHVNQRCGSCDWLGNKSWLSTDDLAIFTANPSHYCFQSAETDDHLCKMGSLSKGAAKVLNLEGHSTVTGIVGIASGAAALKKHTLLKKDRIQIGARADALVNNLVTVNQSVKLGGLAKQWSAEYEVIVNFDSGSGFLTGIALRGVLSAPYGRSFAEAGQPPKSLMVLGEAAFVVPKDNAAAEWTALQSFVDTLATWVNNAEKTYADKGWGTRVHTQVCFWEPRQYEELCNAFGRHLLKVLDLSGRSQRALAWIFPSEQLMEKEDEICPSIVFIRDLIHSSVLLPERFAMTLLGTVEHYHHASLTPRKIDKYYVEPLGNAIPRERIFDIWKSPTGTVKLYGKVVSITEAIERYGSVLKAHAWALGSITARLRSDLRGSLSGKAPVLQLSFPSGMTGVAQDSKLWSQWSVVSAAAADTEGRTALIAPAEWLESSYKAIVLDSLITDHGNHTYTFFVNEESTEAKIEEGDAYCTVGIASISGFPLESASSLSLNINSSLHGYYMPMHSIIAAKIDSFDRANRTAIITLRPRHSKVADIFREVMDSGVVPIGAAPIYILEGLPYDDTDATQRILRAIGNPACARTAPEALDAMGKSAAKKLPAGSDADTPVARILWAADKVSATKLRTPSEVKAIVSFAKTANRYELNYSQADAVAGVAESQLSIVWGPPGTGKTDTLVAFLHAVVRERKQRVILLTGPNYRTVEELAGRLAVNLNGDLKANCDFYWVYSKTRDPKNPPSVKGHVNLKSFRIDAPEAQEMVQGVNGGSNTTVIATTAHMVNRVIEMLGASGSFVAEIFDLVVLDESSQIPVTLALRPMSGLRKHGQLVIAGDHLQMPPIHSLDPPTNAEHLVSSIQTYLLKRFGIKRQELLVNYRSNQDIVEFAKTLKYPEKLTAHSPIKQVAELKSIGPVVATLPSGLPVTDAYKLLLDPGRRVATLIHDDAISSQANDVEAGLVAGLAYCVRKCMARELDMGVPEKRSAFDDDFFFEVGIGIVTPHKAQKALVVRALLGIFPNADPQKVYDAVDTVERFQGGERHTIIVSFGVGDTDIIEGEEAFLLQMERTNVAISRAMAKCIVIMPKALAYHLPTDPKAADASVAIKSYVEEFCANRTSTTISFNGVSREAEVRWH
ncbi:MAG: ATP-binding protein [Bryobacteraceae bacterium]|nr:ATP-binding protein [Bryobacteraceae bacterium]